MVVRRKQFRNWDRMVWVGYELVSELFFSTLSFIVVFVIFLKSYYKINGAPYAWGHHRDKEIEFVCHLKSFGEEA